MDSINKNQKEDNFKDLAGQEGLDKIKELVKAAGACFFCTGIVTGQPFDTRPMVPEEIDDNGNFWFLSADDSHKNKELEIDPSAQLLFQGSSYSGFLTLYGWVTISKDKQRIKELWDPTMKNWFTEGVDDPRITVLQFTPTQGQYWDTKHGMAIAAVKRVIGAIKGETYDDSIEGKVEP